MPLQNHLEALRRKHAEIDSHISELERAPSVKDEIERLA